MFCNWPSGKIWQIGREITQKLVISDLQPDIGTHCLFSQDRIRPCYLTVKISCLSI